MKKKSSIWGMMFIIIIFLLILSMFIGSIGGGNNKNRYGSGRCTICGKSATQTFQGSGYCDKHYKDAVSWAFDHVK